jgi:hypothetical protein
VLIRAVCGHDLGYLPARDVDTLRVSDVRAAVRQDPEAEELKSVLERRVSPGLRELMRITEQADLDGPANLTLRQLAQTAREEERGEMVDSPSKEVEVLDAKQPEVPS